jgi:hypothetical protein
LGAENKVSLRPILIHACFDQRAGNPRPVKCKCRYRISSEQAEEYVKQGLASYLIVGWRKDSAGTSIPVEGPNLVWGGKLETKDEELETVRSVLALKTPRVMTIEKSNIERAYVGTKEFPKGSPLEQERINEWGRLAQEVISDLTVEYAPDFVDPFEGKPVFYFIGYEPRTKGGFTQQKNKNKT